jgi:hypothetical protein
MRSVAYWIQRADFSASDHETADAEDAIRAFRTHDWGEELRLQAELETAGRDCCPPGIGFVDPRGPILHVCPTVGGTCMVHYHPTRTRRFLGFIPISKGVVQTKPGVEQTDVVELIHSFFAGRHDWVLRKLAAA